MPKLTKALPKYRRHASGQAVVTIGGRDFYLGKHGSKASKEKYSQVLAEWLASDRPASLTSPTEITVTEVCAAFLRYAGKHYVKRGRVTSEVAGYKVLFRVLKELYGGTRAAQFGPKQMKAVRAKMLDADASRPYINKQMVRLRHLMKWAAAEEMIPVDVYQRLSVVPGIRKGEAREVPAVAPVDDSVVDATLPFLRPVVAAMIQFERLTGARPDEVCRMRPCDIDRSGDIWRYVPESHKTEHHGRGRIIFIGPKAQEVLRPYLFGDDLPCFRSPRSPKGLNTRSYRERIHSGVRRANATRGSSQQLPEWNPNQLRHSAATEIRAKFGLEAAQVALGHSRADVTQVYAERDQRLAVEVARQVG